ncbi:MAG: hypothetical protein AABW71_01635 [Nanoarchaeota archaeon]
MSKLIDFAVAQVPGSLCHGVRRLTSDPTRTLSATAIEIMTYALPLIGGVIFSESRSIDEDYIVATGLSYIPVALARYGLYSLLQAAINSPQTE